MVFRGFRTAFIGYNKKQVEGLIFHLQNSDKYGVIPIERRNSFGRGN